MCEVGVPPPPPRVVVVTVTRMWWQPIPTRRAMQKERGEITITLIPHQLSTPAGKGSPRGPGTPDRSVQLVREESAVGSDALALAAQGESVEMSSPGR